MKEQNERNISIDIAKVVATFMIFILHTLLGGVIQKPLQGASQAVAWYMEYFCFTSVNIYALISGYLNYNKEVKWKRIAKMCGELVIFSLIAFGIAILLQRETFTVNLLLEAIFPINHQQYWYFNAYLIVVFLMPFLNAGIKNMNQKTHKYLVVLGACVFSLLPTIFMQIPFWLDGGYSGLWITYLYIVGAYIRKYIAEETIKKNRIKYFAIAFLLPAILMINNLCSGMGEWMANMKTYANNYNHFLTFVSSISLFLLLLKCDVKSKAVRKIVISISSVTLWMYIFHCSTLLFSIMKNVLKYLIAVDNPVMMIASVIVVATVLFAGFYLASLIIHKLYNLIIDKASKLFSKKSET